MLSTILSNKIAATIAPNVGGWVMGYAFRPNRNNWYKDLKKPSWTPPNWVFGPMWTVLYSGMGYASYLVYRDGGGFGGEAKLALALYGSQLLINWSWTPIFFGCQSTLGGLVNMGVLLPTVLATTYEFFAINKTAGSIMLPYIAWLGVACALNLSIHITNKDKGQQP